MDTFVTLLVTGEGNEGSGEVEDKPPQNADKGGEKSGQRGVVSIDWLQHNLAENAKDGPTLNGTQIFKGIPWLQELGVARDADDQRAPPAEDTVLVVQMPPLRIAGQPGAVGNVARSKPEVTDKSVGRVAEVHALVVVLCPGKDVAMQLELLMHSLQQYKRLEAILWCRPKAVGAGGSGLKPDAQHHAALIFGERLCKYKFAFEEADLDIAAQLQGGHPANSLASGSREFLTPMFMCGCNAHMDNAPCTVFADFVCRVVTGNLSVGGLPGSRDASKEVTCLAESTSAVACKVRIWNSVE